MKLVGAQTFGANNTDRVTLPTTPFTDLALWTVIALVYHTGTNGGKNIIGKGAAADNTRHIEFRTASDGVTARSLACTLDRATSDLNYSTSGTPITDNTWVWTACRFDPNATAGDLVAFYVSTSIKEPLQKVAAGTATDGSGAFNSDSGKTIAIANNSGNNAYQGSIAYMALTNTNLSLQELQAIQRNPWAPIRGQLGVWFLGANGTGLVLDHTGRNNFGTISGSVLNPNIIPVMKP